jgi:hypothetical protein
MDRSQIQLSGILTVKNVSEPVTIKFDGARFIPLIGRIEACPSFLELVWANGNTWFDVGHAKVKLNLIRNADSGEIFAEGYSLFRSLADFFARKIFKAKPARDSK